MTGDCRRCREALRRGAEMPADLAPHREHLAACAACRRERLRRQALAAALAPSPAPPPPEGMAERLMLRLEAEGCLSPVASTRAAAARPLWLRLLLAGLALLFCAVSARVGAVAVLQFWLAAARWQTRLFCTEVGVRDSLAFLLLLEVAWLAGWLAWREWNRYRQPPRERAC